MTLAWDCASIPPVGSAADPREAVDRAVARGSELLKLSAAPDLELAAEGWVWQPTAGGTLLLKLAARPAEQLVTVK